MKFTEKEVLKALSEVPSGSMVRLKFISDRVCPTPKYIYPLQGMLGRLTKRGLVKTTIKWKYDIEPVKYFCLTEKGKSHLEKS